MLLRRLISERRITSQDELVALLERGGHPVTQTTVSRDLATLGIEKVQDEDGGVVYALPAPGLAPDPASDELRGLLQAFALEIEHSRNLAVVKTRPGSASPIASALDRDPPEGVLGTVAGDDTVLVVTRNEDGGARLARNLRRLIGG
jgi:transcriptional regulator of arginine metabolism